MNTFRQSIPAEFTDEDRWRLWQFSLSRTTFFTLLGGLGFTCILYKVFTVLGIPFVGVVIGLFITIAVSIVTGVKVPQSEYLKGGGLTVFQLLLRLFIRKNNKVVYVRAYGKDLDK